MIFRALFVFVCLIFLKTRKSFSQTQMMMFSREMLKIVSRQNGQSLFSMIFLLDFNWKLYLRWLRVAAHEYILGFNCCR